MQENQIHVLPAEFAAGGKGAIRIVDEAGVDDFYTRLAELGRDASEVAREAVLESGELRDGIKIYSNWPTIPQLYVKGEFVGGCDIIREMFQAGELQQLFADKGVTAQQPAG